jgi:hypothetical protein
VNKIVSSFFGKAVWPLLVLILTPVATLLGGKLQSGGWLGWIGVIPLWVYFVFGGAVLVWLTATLLFRRMRKLKNANLPALPLFYSTSMWGYTRVAELPYKRVLWRILARNPPAWENMTVRELCKTQGVEIETPPICPNCKTELEETETLFGRYMSMKRSGQKNWRNRIYRITASNLCRL